MTNVRKTLTAQVVTSSTATPLGIDFKLAVTLYAGVAPSITPKFVGSGGGGAPYAFTIVAGGAPTGMTLNSNGTLAGTPTTQGNYPITVQVQDALSNVYSKSFVISVTAALVGVNVTPTPGEQGIAYRYQFLVRDLSGVTITSGFSVSVGSVPAGMAFHSNGILDGTPTAPAVGITYFTVNVTVGGASLNIPCSVTVYSPLTAANLPVTRVIIGHQTEIVPTISGGLGPYTVALNTGVIPGELSYSTRTGIITGVQLDSPGGYVSNWKVTDALGATATYNIPITVIYPTSINSQSGGVTVGSADGSVVINTTSGNIDLSANPGLVIRARLATAATLPSNVYNNGVSGVGATLTAAANGALSIDGVACAANDVVNVMLEAATANCGAYVVTNPGGASAKYVLTRDSRMDGSTEFTGQLITTGPEGTANKNQVYECTALSPIVVGTTPITFQSVGAIPAVHYLQANFAKLLSAIQPGDYCTINKTQFALNLAAYVITSKQLGSVQIDVRVQSNPATRPTAGDSITAGNYITMSSNTYAAAAIASWLTTIIAAGSRIEFYVVSCSGISDLTVQVNQ